MPDGARRLPRCGQQRPRERYRLRASALVLPGAPRVEADHEPVEVWERRPGAALAPVRRYRRREPEKTLLHEVVRSQLEPFLASARERSTYHQQGNPRKPHRTPSKRVAFSDDPRVGVPSMKRRPRVNRPSACHRSGGHSRVRSSFYTRSLVATRSPALDAFSMVGGAVYPTVLDVDQVIPRAQPPKTRTSETLPPASRLGLRLSSLMPPFSASRSPASPGRTASFSLPRRTSPRGVGVGSRAPCCTGSAAPPGRADTGSASLRSG